jgi:hypothetical protein
MENRPTPHPSLQALKAFGMGELDRAAALAIETRLAACPECREKVSALRPFANEESAASAPLPQTHDGITEKPARAPGTGKDAVAVDSDESWVSPAEEEMPEPRLSRSDRSNRTRRRSRPVFYLLVAVWVIAVLIIGLVGFLGLTALYYLSDPSPFGILEVTVNVPGATVMINDQILAETSRAPPYGVKKSVRNWQNLRVVVKKPGFDDWSQEVEVYGNNKTVHAELKPSVGRE